jgi:hypothetical protein
VLPGGGGSGGSATPTAPGEHPPFIVAGVGYESLATTLEAGHGVDPVASVTMRVGPGGALAPAMQAALRKHQPFAAEYGIRMPLKPLNAKDEAEALLLAGYHEVTTHWVAVRQPHVIPRRPGGQGEEGGGGRD